MAEIKKIEDLKSFDEFVNAEGLNVLKIGADFCGPCKVLETIMHDLTDEEISGVLLAETDADEEWFEDKLVELKIRGIPVLIAYKDGEEKERIIGGVNKETLLSFFERNK